MTMERFFTDIKELEGALGDGVFLVLSDNLRGLFAFGIRVRTKGSYAHMMWKVPGGLASQSLTFRHLPLHDYAGCTMKFIHNPDWTEEQKRTLLSKIQEDLDKPWYRRFYDIPAIIGQLFGCDWLQFGKAMICSERIVYLRYIDPEADEWLKEHPTPTPTDVNKWTKDRKDRYEVFARYSPD